VLRVIRGESAATVAAASGVDATQLETWRREFLEAAMSRMGA
jgi:transposase-like protein